MAESGTYTPETLQRRAKIAEAMMADPKRPITHWAEGLNELLKGAVGGYQLNKIEGEEKAGRAEMNKALASLLGGDAGSPMAAMTPSGESPLPPPTAGPRSPSFSPVTTEPAEPPAPPSPYKLAGMAPLNSQDTFNTPLDVMAPRAQVASALRTATGAPPPMSGMTPAGATPVQTQPITPPQPSPAINPMAAPTTVMPPRPISAPAASVGAPPDAGRAKIAAMLQSGNPYVQRLGQKLAGSYLTPEKPTDEMREYELYRRQGGKESFYDYKTGMKRAGAIQSNVQIDQRQESEFAKEAGKTTAKRFDDYVKAGNEATGMIADFDALREIGGRITTGKTAEIKAALGPYAEALGVKIDQLGDLQAYNAIVAKMTPRMRVPGSGATSDFEMQQFMQSLPTLGKTPEGNKIIADTQQALLAHRQAVGEIGSRALSGELAPREAEKKIRELPDPMAMWRKSRATSPAAAPSTGAPASGKTRTGIPWSVQ